jgi:hypothetical protein
LDRQILLDKLSDKQQVEFLFSQKLSHSSPSLAHGLGHDLDSLQMLIV